MLTPPPFSYKSTYSILLATLLTAWSAPNVYAAANQIETDNSTNPPSLSITGNSENVGLGLITGKWGSWTNIIAISDSQTDSDLTGINLYSSDSDHTQDFQALGHTKIYLKSLDKDGSSVNLYGATFSQGASGREIKATFNSLEIYAEAVSGKLSRSKGLWMSGQHQLSGPDSDKVTLQATVDVKGDLNIFSKSTGYAIGVNVGDELGDQNAHGGGKLTLSGANNVIKIEQTGTQQEAYVRVSAGAVVSSTASMSITGGTTNIITQTHHAGRVSTVQGGVIVDRDSKFSSSGLLTIDSTVTNNSQKNYLHGVSADLYASTMYQDQAGSVVTLGDTNITLHTNDKTQAYGISSYGSSNITSSGLVQIDLDVSQADIGGIGTFNAIYAGSTYTKGLPEQYLKNMKGGHVTLNGGLIVAIPDVIKPGQDGIYALHASGELAMELDRSPTITAVGTESDLYQLEGNLNANCDGRIELALANSNSYITGWANNHVNGPSKAGTIDIKLGNGATWNVISKISAKDGSITSSESSINTLELNGGVLNLAYASRNNLTDWEEHTHRQHLTITGTDKGQGLSGKDGTIWMDINLADEGSADSGLNLDQITIKGEASGTHNLAINFINGLSGISADKWHSDNWLIEQESGSMTLTGPNGKEAFSGRGMVSMWEVKFVAEGEEGKLETDRESLDNTSIDKPNNGKGHWYLVRYDREEGGNPTDPDNPNVPPEINDNLVMGTSTGQALAYLADLEDLRKRLGEVRYGAQEGAWVKAFNKKDSVDTSGTRGFEQEAYGFNIGVDRLVATDEASSWLVGAAFRYSKADQEGLATGSLTGKLDEYSAKAYASWMSRSGSYADFVAQVGRYDQELKGLDNTGLGSSHADYKNWGYGASVEVGHMFTLGDSVDDRQWYNHFFIEPQVQLSYFHVNGEDYKTSTGLAVSQGDAEFLTGRAGVVLGKKFNYGTVDELDRRYFQVALIGGVKHEFLGGDQTITYRGIDGDSVKVHADDIDGTRFYYGVNFDWQVAENFRIYAQVDREEGDNYTKDYDVSVGAKWLF